MSIGNLKSEGNKGNNFPWQLKMLKGLQGIIDTLNAGVCCPPQARTTNFLRPTGVSGTIAAGTFSMSFASVGTANATVGGMILKPGETINFDAGALNNTLGAVAYDTTTAGAELIIITLT
jgi:hypothetical protein